MEAEVKPMYKNNNTINVLLISKEDNSPMLFLEWLSDFSPETLYRIDNDIENNQFRIELNVSEEKMYQAMRYINANL